MISPHYSVVKVEAAKMKIIRKMIEREGEGVHDDS
jgi:hypothetical protein